MNRAYRAKAQVLPQFIALDGEWDLSRKRELDDLCDTLSPLKPATIDLRGCTYLDSTVLATLAETRMRFAEVPITLLGPNGMVHRILKIVAFDRLFRIAEGC